MANLEAEINALRELDTQRVTTKRFAGLVVHVGTVPCYNAAVIGRFHFDVPTTGVRLDSRVE
jgi:hypothetical protein